MSIQKQLTECLYEDKRSGKILLCMDNIKSDNDTFPVVDFLLTNENYTDEALAAVRSLRGMTGYVGICGGGTQNIQLMGELSKDNMLEDVRLVDMSGMQLHNFRKLAEIYNNSKSDEEYAGALEMYARINGEPYLRLFSYTPNCKRASLKTDTLVKLRKYYIQDYFGPGCRSKLEGLAAEQDINSEVGLVERKGKYFIYLSNALYDYLDGTESLKVMDDIRNNENVEDGSAVLMVDALPSDVIMLEKNGYAFSILHGETYAFCNSLFALMKDADMILEV